MILPSLLRFLVISLALHCFSSSDLHPSPLLPRSGTPIPGVSRAISHLLDTGLKVVFVTNSSGSNRSKMAAKLTKLMGRDIPRDMCLPTCYTAAWYMKKHHPDVDKVYVIGGQGIGELKEGEQNGGFCVASVSRLLYPLEILRFITLTHPLSFQWTS